MRGFGALGFDDEHLAVGEVVDRAGNELEVGGLAHRCEVSGGQRRRGGVAVTDLERDRLAAERHHRFDVVDRFEVGDQLVVDSPAVALDRVVGTRQVVELRDREVLDAGARDRHERDEEDADQKRVRCGRCPLRIAGRVGDRELPFESEAVVPRAAGSCCRSRR